MVSSVGCASFDRTEMMQQMRERMFAKVDQNGDGSVDLEEMQATADKMSEKSGMSIDVSADFTKADLDGDGKVSKEEFMQFEPPKPPGPPPGMAPSENSFSSSNQADIVGTLLDALNESKQTSALNILA